MSNKLELDVRKAMRQLYDEQLAFVFKVPEAMEQTPCDFFGFTRRGVAVLLECKQVKRASLPTSESPGLAPHQWTALKQGAACGAIAAVVWQRGPSVTVLPFREAEALAEGRRSIAWQDRPGTLLEQLRALLSADRP